MKRDSTPTDFDAVVIGAGPAGSAVAILLARAGWSVALVEKQIFPRRKVCGECIAASNWPLLEALGVRAEKAGAPLHRMVLMHGTDSISAALPRADDLSTDLSAAQAHPWGRAWGRETLDTLLIAQAHLAGVHVFQPCAVREVNGAAGGWRIKIRPSQSDVEFTLNAPVAIAALGRKIVISKRGSQHNGETPMKWTGWASRLMTGAAPELSDSDT